jgi:hypothetical protein
MTDSTDSDELVSVSFSKPQAAIIHPPATVLDPCPGWQFIADANTGVYHHLPTPEWLQEQTDRIKELERSLHVALAEKNMIETTLGEERTEADTLAVAVLGLMGDGGFNEALAIAERRVSSQETSPISDGET